MDTRSRGFVYARSPHLYDEPWVRANYMQEDYDLQSQMTRFKNYLQLVEAQAVRPFLARRYIESFEFLEAVRWLIPSLERWMSCIFRSPDDNRTRISIPCLPVEADDDQAIEKFLRGSVVSSYHYFGTAAAGSVVKHDDFSVIGTKNLYVADASIIPSPTEVNPQVTIMALGWYIGSKLANQSSASI